MELRNTVYVKPCEARAFLGLGRRQWEKLVQEGLVKVHHFLFHRKGKMKGKPKDRGMVRRDDVLRLSGD